MHDPGTATDRLDVDDALPATASGVIHVVILRDDSGEDGGTQLENAPEGRMQANVGGRVGRVRLKLEDHVRRVLRKVDRER